MFVPSVLAIVAFASLSAASLDTESYKPQYVPIQLVVDPLLKELSNSLKNLETRQAGQFSKLPAQLRESVQNNRLINLVNKVTLPSIEFRQKQQNERLDELEVKVATIQALRTKTQSLQNAAAAINDQINNVVYLDRKQVMYDISNLQNINLEQNAQILEAQQRVNDVRERVDVLDSKACANTLELFRLDIARKDVTQELNVQTTTTNPVFDLQPNTENSTMSFPDPDLLNPVRGLIGFHAVKQPTYQHGYPSLYFGITDSIGDKILTVSSTDMSSGGWVVEQVYVKFVYAEITEQVVFLK